MSKLERVVSIIGSLWLAHFYACLERWMDWRQVHEFFKAFPRIGVVQAYHYLFMPILFLFIGGLPVLDNIIQRRRHRWRRDIILMIGNMFLTGLVEDASYWYMWGEWIPETAWVAKVIGYIKPFGVVVPTWYIIFAVIIVLSYLYVFCDWTIFQVLKTRLEQCRHVLRSATRLD